MLCSSEVWYCAGFCKTPLTCKSTGFCNRFPGDVLAVLPLLVASTRTFCDACKTPRTIQRKCSTSASVRHWHPSSAMVVSMRRARKSPVSVCRASRSSVPTVMCGTASRNCPAGRPDLFHLSTPLCGLPYHEPFGLPCHLHRKLASRTIDYCPCNSFRGI